jgi:hypothetical protein
MSFGGGVGAAFFFFSFAKFHNLTFLFPKVEKNHENL